MERYTAFAYIYDDFMDNIPYDKWCGYLHELLMEQGVAEGTIVELGCGTGRVTRALADYGYDMVGIDLSEDMLTQASCYEYDIVYSRQDMRGFQIPYKVQAVVSISDSMNYIRNQEDLCRVFERVNDCLEDGGVLIFDLKTDYYFKYIVGNVTRTDIRDDAVLIWENEYDEPAMDNMYYLTMFLREDKDDELYQRYEEEHVQHAFGMEEVIQALKDSGLEPECVYEAFTRIKPGSKSERLYYIARKPHQ